MSCFKNIISKPSKFEILGEIFWTRIDGRIDGRIDRPRMFRRLFGTRSQLTISDTITLNDNIKIPRFGLGVYDIDAKLTRQSVLWALECGYRQIDTAERYQNEECVGKAIRESAVKRGDIFVVTKVYHTNHGYHESRKAFEKSLNQLGLDYVDLYLIHFPVPGKVVETWKAMVELREKGLIRYKIMRLSIHIHTWSLSID